MENGGVNMECLDIKADYNGVRFYGKSDLGNAWQLQMAETVLSSFTPDKNYENVNEIIELYNVQRLIDSGVALDSWSPEQHQSYKDTVRLFNRPVGTFFSQISDDNFLEIISTVSILYMDDFWKLFVRFKVFKRVSSALFENYLKSPGTMLHPILENKILVDCYGTQLANVMRTSDQTVRILVTKYLETTTTQLFIPKELKAEEFEPIFLKYIESKQVNPKVLQLIYSGQSTKECPISDKLRLKARRAAERFWDNNKETMTLRSYSIGVGLGFVEQSNAKEIKQDGATIQLTYDIGWLEDSLDYPTILNNFFYLFEMFDGYFRSSLVSVKSQMSAFEHVFAPQGIKFYKKGMQFDIKNNASTLQTALYYDFLKNHNIDLEEVFKWFFETYLPEEFGVQGLSMSVSSPSATYVERCRSLASEMDGVFKQFRMYVLDGEIDRELFEMSSEHIVISNIPSLISNKYAYPKSEDLKKEIVALFSDQSVLAYIEKTKSKYRTLFELLTHEKVKLSDFVEWQQQYIRWLSEKGSVSIADDETIFMCYDRIWVLKDIYDNDVACVYNTPYPAVIQNMISTGDLRLGSTLFTEPEQDYLNYVLNKSEFSNGLDLRNKYIHSTYPKKENVQRTDYITLLKLMVLVVTKINDELCTLNFEKRETL